MPQNTETINQIQREKEFRGERGLRVLYKGESESTHPFRVTLDPNIVEEMMVEIGCPEYQIANHTVEISYGVHPAGPNVTAEYNRFYNSQTIYVNTIYRLLCEFNKVLSVARESRQQGIFTYLKKKLLYTRLRFEGRTDPQMDIISGYLDKGYEFATSGSSDLYAIALLPQFIIESAAHESTHAAQAAHLGFNRYDTVYQGLKYVVGYTGHPMELHARHVSERFSNDPHYLRGVEVDVLN